MSGPGPGGGWRVGPAAAHSTAGDRDAASAVRAARFISDLDLPGPVTTVGFAGGSVPFFRSLAPGSSGVPAGCQARPRSGRPFLLVLGSPSHKPLSLGENL